MEVETDNIRASKEINRSDEKVHRADNRVGVVPHYLRASTGSCHDACKYGTPHVFREKPWKTTSKSLSAPLPDAEKTLEIRIFLDKKVKKSVEAGSLEYQSKASATVDKVRRSSPLFRRSPVHESSKLLKNEAKPFKKSPPPEAPKIMSKPIRSPGRLFLPDASKVSKQEVASAAKKDVSSRRTPSTPKGRSASAGPLRNNGVATRAPLSPDIFTGSRGKQSSETKFSDAPRSSKFIARKGLTPAATTLSVKRSPKLEVQKPLDPPSTAMPLFRISGISTARSNHVRKTDSNCKIDLKQRSQSATKNSISSSKTGPIKPVTETADEKTMHMIETKEEGLPSNPSAYHFVQSPPLSPESLNSSSQANSLSFTSHEVDEQYELDTDDRNSDADESVSNYNSSGDAEAVDSMQCSSRNASSCGDQDPASLKLKFRRGKVVELQSNTNSPRKQRFRPGKSLDGASADSDSRRKSFKKAAAVSGQKEADVGLVQVALKHQEVMTKDEQVLLNNVIEETAIKLVKKKKSRVKALVGAFETVILLQERKPSAANR